MSKKSIIYLNHSLFKQSNCLKRLEFIAIDGLSQIAPSVAPEYGSAFHVFIKNICLGQSFDISLTLALEYFSKQPLEFDEKEFRTITHLALTCRTYYEQVYKIDNFKPLKDNDN